MPECKFGLNDKIMMANSIAKGIKPKNDSLVQLDDCHFHQCVKLGTFDSERTINFIPPDGEFELMKYRTTENIILPFKVRAVVNEILNQNRVEYKISVRSNYSPKIFAQNIEIRIPTPNNTANTKISVNGGKAKYVGSENCFVWKYVQLI
jgi:AP-2 complex subunit mu-1